LPRSGIGQLGLINNEGSSPVAQPSVGDAAVAAADYANAELGGIGGHPIKVIRAWP
jgi:branched-chain amino acid transport system substrate-binding protein